MSDTQTTLNEDNSQSKYWKKGVTGRLYYDYESEENDIMRESFRWEKSPEGKAASATYQATKGEPRSPEEKAAWEIYCQAMDEWKEKQKPANT